MNLNELKNKAKLIIDDFKNNWKLPKENNNIDYKLKLNLFSDKTNIDTFLINLWKDIISFSNWDWWIIFIWFNEDKSTWIIKDEWLDKDNIDFLKKIDLNDLEQQFIKICSSSTSFDLQHFNVWTREFYYLLIEKSNDILVPKNDFKHYKINKWEILYRISWKNEQANKWSSEFNRFIQVKANEKSKEFMQIWSNLLPEMVDINPKEVLIINPLQNKVYGFNNKDYTLSWWNIEIDNKNWNIFNIILDTIKSWDIWKITDNEWKPIYKIVWEITEKWKSEQIQLSSLTNEIQKDITYKITTTHIKQICYYLQWTKNKKFNVVIKDESDEKNINEIYNKFIWIENVDILSGSKKVVFSKDAIEELIKIISDKDLHIKVFWKELQLKNNSILNKKI